MSYLNIEKSIDFIDAEGEEANEVKENEESKTNIEMSNSEYDRIINYALFKPFSEKASVFDSFVEFESKKRNKSIEKKKLHKIQSTSSSSSSRSYNKNCNWLQRSVSKPIAQVNHESKKFKNPYPCCDSVSENKRLIQLMRKFGHDYGHSYKTESIWSTYLLYYHPHEFKDPNVKYYNPRKGLETIDGLKYNSLPQTNSSLKEIQYEFNFKFFNSGFKFKRHKKKNPKIKLASVFDTNEMEKLVQHFNENKEYRHQRKIKYKNFFNQEIYLQNKSNYHEIIENKNGIIRKSEYSDLSEYSDESGNSYSSGDSYAFFYTDALTALSILAEKVIYPSQITAGLNNTKEPKTFEKPNVSLLWNEFKPNCPDSYLRKEIDNFYWKPFYENCNPKFNKLEYCFGFKFDDLNGKNNDVLSVGLEHSFSYKYEKKINLRKLKFILVKRQFKNCVLHKP